MPTDGAPSYTTSVRILYLGLPLGAVVLLRAGLTPVGCMIGHPDAIGMRRLRRTLPRETLILGRPSLDDAAVRAAIASTGYDVLLSWFWPKRIPMEVITDASRGAFGVHPSLLPRWRGPDPYFHAIRAGDAETGVTLHRLDAEYDTGALIDRRSLAIRDDDTGWTLARRLDRPSLALLVSCAERLGRGEELPGAPQPDRGITLAPRPEEDDLVLDFEGEDADALARLVRAAAPEPGASALLEETLVTVQRARSWRGAFPSGLRAGEAFLAPEGVVVRARRDGLLLERVRVEEDDRLVEGAAIGALLREGEGAPAVEPTGDQG